MYRKAAVIGVSALAVVGVGTAVAVASTGHSSGTTGLPGIGTTPSSSASSSASPAAKAGKQGKHGKDGKHKKHDGKGLLKRIEHGQVVVQGKDGKPQTVTVVQGTVTAVSASAISVQAADKTSQTYAVGSGTVVHEKTDATHGKTTIAKVAKGDHVFVLGTGSPLTATRILDTGTK